MTTTIRRHQMSKYQTVEEWLGKENQLGRDIWEKKYRYNNESFPEWIDRVSGGDSEVAELIEDKKFLFGGRTLANRGTGKKGSFSNCYSRGFVEDNLDDIMQANTDIARTFKAQGGQGISLSKLRPKGCGINHGQFSSDGIVPFMEIYNRTTESISQGGSRKGALIMSIDIWHKEASQFITIKSEEGRIQKANLSLEIDDEFMECVKKYYDTGEVIKKEIIREYEGNRVTYEVVPIELYKLMMKTAYDWAEPGCIFCDPFRNYNMMEYCDDYQVQTCNPSLRAGTKVLTDSGIFNIENLVGKKFLVQTLNYEYAQAECFLSGKNQPLYEIELENGEKYYATKEHKWAILNNGRYTKTFTEDLQAGDLLPYTKNNTLGFGTKGTYEDGLLIGYWYGDGHITIRKDDGRYQYGFTFGKEKADVGLLDFIKNKLEKITNKDINYYTRNRGKEDWYEICCGDASLKQYMFSFGVYSDKHELPKFIYNDLSEEFRKGFIDGLFSADGSVDLTQKGQGVSLTTCSYKFAKSISDLLWWYGIRNHISKQITKLNSKEYDRYELKISQRAANIFAKIFRFTHSNKQKRLNKIPDNIRNLKSDGHIKIKNVKLTDMLEDVYDIHVFDDSHTFRINYCITGNCGEQPLPKHGACNLASLNLSEFVNKPFTDGAYFDYESFSKAVKVAIRGLDDVLDENMDNHPLKEQREMAYNYRNVGLGIMGLADCLIKLGITYGDIESITLMDNIMHVMFASSVIASINLAKVKGAFPKYNPKLLDSTIIKNHFTNEQLDEIGATTYGLRNCSLLSIAPTGSLGTMLNISTGCEPIFAMSYTRKTESLNNNQDKYYKVYTGIAKEYIDKFGGELPDYFVESKDINWKDRVDMQSILQKHVDTAISSTINLPNEITVDEIETLYLYAWEKKLKGITIFRDGCKRTGILSVSSHDDNGNKDSAITSMNDLPRGFIVKADDNCIGKKRTLITGCGSLHCVSLFDPVTGDLLETYLSKGSTGGCNNFMIGLSRMISLSARGGVDIYSIVDQLKSSGTCPSYAVRRATKKDTSKGSCCPVAIGNALIEMYKELQSELGLVDEKDTNITYPSVQTNGNKPKCPECGEPLIFEGGCNICKSCGWSKCD